MEHACAFARLLVDDGVGLDAPLARDDRPAPRRAAAREHAGRRAPPLQPLSVVRGRVWRARRWPDPLEGLAARAPRGLDARRSVRLCTPRSVREARYARARALSPLSPWRAAFCAG